MPVTEYVFRERSDDDGYDVRVIINSENLTAQEIEDIKNTWRVLTDKIGWRVSIVVSPSPIYGGTQISSGSTLKVPKGGVAAGTALYGQSHGHSHSDPNWSIYSGGMPINTFTGTPWRDSFKQRIKKVSYTIPDKEDNE